jgi:hypothetical protein
MRRMGWTGAAAATVAVMLGGAQIIGAVGQDRDSQDRSDRGHGNRCSESTIRGDYGVQIQGTRPAPGGQTESVIGVIFRHYDGRGNVTQIDNVKGSITGTVPDREGSGTYEINANCTGIIYFQPGPGILLEERLVVIDDGREIRTAVMAPAGVMVTGVQQRIHDK